MVKQFAHHKTKTNHNISLNKNQPQHFFEQKTNHNISSKTKQLQHFFEQKPNNYNISSNKNQGTADLKSWFGPKKHEVSVSTYQMVILLLFNAKETYSYKELKEVKPNLCNIRENKIIKKKLWPLNIYRPLECHQMI